MRYPSLEDYDGGRKMEFWAANVAAHAMAPYDEEFRPEDGPPQKTSVEVRGDAEVQAQIAEERYRAYRANIRIEEEEANKRRLKEVAAREARRRKEREEELERARVREQEIASARSAARDAFERQQRWWQEQAQWTPWEDGVKRHAYLGFGHRIRMIQDAHAKRGDITVNLHKGELWDVSELHRNALVSRQFAVDV